MAKQLDTLVPLHQDVPLPKRSLSLRRLSHLQAPRAQVLGAGDRGGADIDEEFGTAKKADDVAMDGGVGKQRAWRRFASFAVHGMSSRYQRGVADRSKAMDDRSNWVNRQLNLPGSIALMLPSDKSPWPVDGSDDGLQRRFKDRCSVQTTYCGKPHRIFILELDDPGQVEEESAQLQWLGILAENATNAVRPADGPWMWPLHNNAASSAILTAYMARVDRLDWWRQALWALRILPPKGGSETERQLAKHYGASVAYVFAWSNLYIRGLWVLVAILIFAWFFDTHPDEVGTWNGIYWNVVQFGTLLWCFFIAKEGHSQRRVLSVGGFDDLADAVGKKRREKRKYLHGIELTAQTRALLREGDREALPSESGSSDTMEKISVTSFCTEATVGDSSIRSMNSSAFVPAVARPPPAYEAAPEVGAGSCWKLLGVAVPLMGMSAPAPRGHGTSAAARRPEPLPLDPRVQAATKMQAVTRGYLTRRTARTRVLHRAMLAAHVGSMLEVLKSRNWEFRKPIDRWDHRRQMVVFGVVSVLTVFAFVVICVLVLLSFVQLNIYLTFIWGKCLDPEIQKQALAAGDMCRDPQFVHGIRGWLAEVSSDVSLAVLFDVLLAEAAKGIATFLIKLRNYEWLHQRKYATVMLSLVMEALSKVGLFAILGLVFLPRWYIPVDTSSWIPAEACHNFPDYRMCVALSGCNTTLETTCCQGVLFCVARRLEYSQRRVMFERAVHGPFFVAPFVRILVTVIIPLVARAMGHFVHGDDRGLDVDMASIGEEVDLHKAKLGWRRIVAPVFRICALIFYLNPDNVGGLCHYIARGWPFGSVARVELPVEEQGDGSGEEALRRRQAAEALRGALDQASRKAFEPLDEVMELKMNFLFVSFFAPIMPIGLVPTLLARLLEVRSKATKLFFVRQRCWPGESRLLHETQDSFARIASHMAIVWHTGLIVTAYNPRLYEWPAWQVAGSWVVAIWFVTLVLHLLTPRLHRLRRLFGRRCLS